MVKTTELEPNSAFQNLVGTLTHLEEKRETTSGKPVQDGILEDDGGQVKVTFWDTQVDAFKVGETILMTKGWCKEYEGDLQVSSGKYGDIKKVPPATISEE